MRLIEKVVMLTLLVLALSAGSLASADRSYRSPTPQYFNYTLEPKSLPDKSGPVELVLTFKLKPEEAECDSVQVQIGAETELAYNGPAKFWVSLAETGEYSTTLSVEVPPNDTSTIYIGLGCLRRGQQGLTMTFITTGDVMEVLDYYPISRPPHPQRVVTRSPGQKPVVGTKEQFVRADGQDFIQYDEHTGLEPSDLTTAYEDYMGATTSFLDTVPATWSFEVVIDLRDPDDESAVQRMIAEMTATNLPGYFRGWINKETGTALVERQVYFLRYTGGRVTGRHRPQHQQPVVPADSGDSDPAAPPAQDKSSPQGWPEGISLHHTDGEISPGVLTTGQPITFYLRIYNHLAHMRAISNGYHVYSPDGAEWGTAEGDTIGSVCADMFDYFKILDSTATGSGDDTVGFSGYALGTDGMPEYFDAVSYTITIGPIDDMYAGRTICLDSTTWFGGGRKWEWTDTVNLQYWPEWYGPHCFTIVSPTIEFSGYARYWDMNPEADSTLPIRNAVIDMMDDEGSGSPELVASVTTDANGYFSFPAVDNVDNPANPSDLRDIFFRIHSENEAAKSYVWGDSAFWKSAAATNLPSGVYDTTLVVPKVDTISGPFYSADVLLDAFETWTSPGLGLPVPSQVLVELRDSATSYGPADQDIWLNKTQVSPSPDVYDRDIILHEYGHHLAGRFDFMDDLGPNGTVGNLWHLPMLAVQAGYEGFAYFAACFLSGDSEIAEKAINFTKVNWWDVETGEYGRRFASGPDTTFGSANHIDSTSAQVAGIFWDLYDQPDDNYSACNQDSTNWPWSTTDNVLDSVQFDIGTILGVLLYKNADDGYLADDIDEFQEAWLNAPHSGRSAGMQDVYYEHGIACCTGKRGDANGLGGETPTLGDVSWLIDHLILLPISDRVQLS